MFGSSTFNPTVCCNQLFTFLLNSMLLLSYAGIHLLFTAFIATGNGWYRTGVSHRKLGMAN